MPSLWPDKNPNIQLFSKTPEYVQWHIFLFVFFKFNASGVMCLEGSQGPSCGWSLALLRTSAAATWWSAMNFLRPCPLRIKPTDYTSHMSWYFECFSKMYQRLLRGFMLIILRWWTLTTLATPRLSFGQIFFSQNIHVSKSIKMAMTFSTTRVFWELSQKAIEWIIVAFMAFLRMSFNT